MRISSSAFVLSAALGSAAGWLGYWLRIAIHHLACTRFCWHGDSVKARSSRTRCLCRYLGIEGPYSKCYELAVWNGFHVIHSQGSPGYTLIEGPPSSLLAVTHRMYCMGLQYLMTCQLQKQSCGKRRVRVIKMASRSRTHVRAS